MDDIVSKNGAESSVLLIGRYNFDGKNLTKLEDFFDWQNDKIVSKKYPKLDISFMTAHASKGLGRDNVVIINGKDDVLGFPSKIEDDPVMKLVIKDDESMDFEEERRLFYVALTRTKNRVYIVTPQLKPSKFILNIVIEIINVIVDILGEVIKVVVVLLDIIIDILEPILEIILAILEPLIEFISGIIEVIAELFEILLPLIEVFLTPIMDILDVIFTIVEALSPILVIIGNVIKAVIVPVLQLLFQILKPILDILNAIISAVKWILDHTVGWLVKLIGKMFGTGDFDAENTVKTTSNSYMNTDNSHTTNNVTINTSGDVDMDSINEALGGAY